MVITCGGPTRSIDVSDFDSLYVTGELMGLGGQAASDYAQHGMGGWSHLQSPLLAEITAFRAPLTVNEKISLASGSLSIQVEVENNTSGNPYPASHAFDEVGVFGLKRGCTDADASNYDASPPMASWLRVMMVPVSMIGLRSYSRKDGELNGTIWAGKPCS